MTTTATPSASSAASRAQISPVTTADLLALLERHPHAPLLFDTGEGVVAPGYHVTEFKATQVRAVDCGGVATSWNETVLQVTPPARPEQRHMTAGKFLGIYRRVEAAVPIDPAAQVRVEYGDVGQSALSYLVAGVDSAPEGVRVLLRAPAVACKAADRSVGDIPVLHVRGDAAEGCCTPRGERGACC